MSKESRGDGKVVQSEGDGKLVGTIVMVLVLPIFSATLCSQYTLYNVYCIVYSVYCIVYTV